MRALDIAESPGLADADHPDEGLRRALIGPKSSRSNDRDVRVTARSLSALHARRDRRFEDASEVVQPRVIGDGSSGICAPCTAPDEAVKLITPSPTRPPRSRMTHTRARTPVRSSRRRGRRCARGSHAWGHDGRRRCRSVLWRAPGLRGHVDVSRLAVGSNSGREATGVRRTRGVESIVEDDGGVSLFTGSATRPEGSNGGPVAHGRSMRIESSTASAKSACAGADGPGHSSVVMTMTVPSRSRTHKVSTVPGA